MNTLTPSLLARASGIVAVALLLVLAPSLPAGAQGALSLSFREPFVVNFTSNDETSVGYLDNVVVSPANAALECTPEVGMFPRGATKVDCTATLGSQTKTGSFYVLVAKNSVNPPDTDIQLGPITQDPSPVEPAGYVTYNVEYRPTFDSFAPNVEISTTLPPQVRFYSKSSPNCDTTKLPKITCRVAVERPDSFQIVVQTRPPFQGTYSVTWSLKMLPDDSGKTQLDLFAGNNTASITTEVRVAQAPNRLFLPYLNGE